MLLRRHLDTHREMYAGKKGDGRARARRGGKVGKDELALVEGDGVEKDELRSSGRTIFDRRVRILTRRQRRLSRQRRCLSRRERPARRRSRPRALGDHSMPVRHLPIERPLDCRYGADSAHARVVAMRSVFRVLLIPIVCVAIGMHPRLMLAQTPADGDPVALAIQAQLDALMHSEEVEIQGARIALREQVQEFYSRREFRAAWSNARNAEQLRRALADSSNDGLDPADYHLRCSRTCRSKRRNRRRPTFCALSTTCCSRRRCCASPTICPSARSIRRRSMPVELRTNAREQ